MENMGTHLSIDETSIDHVVYVFLTNKDGHGKKHTLIAYVKGLKVSDIVAVLMQIPEELRKAVIEVTMDHSDVMNAVVRAQWKFSGDKHKSLQVDTERTFHQRYPLAML